MPPPAAAAAAGGPAGAVAGALSGLLQVTGALKDVFFEMANTIKGFVAAIAPSVVLEFNQALKDLHATIGSALIGAMNVFSSVLREVGGIILPLAQKLQPVLTQMANLFANVLVAAVRTVAAVFDAMVPVLEVIVDIQAQYAKLLSDLLGIITAVIRVATDVVGAFLGRDFAGGIKDAFKGFIDIIRQVVKALVTFGATLAVFAGFRDTVVKFGDALKKEADERDARARGLLAAANAPGISDIKAIGDQIQKAAFIAAGGAGGRERSDTEWLREIAKAVGDTAAQRKSIREALDDWWRDIVMAGVVGSVYRFIQGISDKIRNFFNRF